MSQQPPEDEIERLLAAEEAAIQDDGFSARVMSEVEAPARRGFTWRRTAIYGAGTAGFGFAVGGIVELTPHLPSVTGWWSKVSGAAQSAVSAQGSTDPLLLAVGGVAAGVMFLIVGVAATQSR